MAIAKGSNRVLKAALEATYGTKMTDGYHTLYFNENSLGTSNSLVDTNTIVGSREETAPITGLRDVTGSIAVPVDEEAFGLWLYTFFGAKATTGSGPYTHVFTPAAESKSLSVEIGYTDIAKFYVFEGVKVNTMALDFTPGQELVAAMECVGQVENAATGTTVDATPTTYVLDRYQVTNLTMQKGGADFNFATNLTLNISNSLETGIYGLNGGGYREILPEGNFMVNGTFSMLFDDADGVQIYADALAGTEISLTATLTGTGTNSLVFQLDEVVLPQNSPAPSGQGPVTLEVPFKAYYNNGSEGTALKVTMINNTSDYTS